MTFTRMATTVSWKGGEGKQALPENLITELKIHVGTRFGDIGSTGWKQVCNRINDMLRAPRTTDIRRDGEYCSYY